MSSTAVDVMVVMETECRKGQMSAWLQKKKSGSAMMRVRQYNKRYFTIDFDSRVFFYTHAENSKKVASMIPFADIMDVRLPEPHMDKGDNVSECSRTSKVSWMKRLGSGTRLGEEEHFVTVLVKPARTMELLCSSSVEAQQWFEAFKAAIADRGEDEDTASVGVPCDAGGNDSPTSGDGPVKFDSELAADDTGGHAPAVADSEAAPPPVKGTFLDLTTEPSAGPGPGQTASAEAAAVMDLGPAKLQATQFGFDGEADSGSSAASSPAASPRGNGASGAGGLGHGSLDLAGAVEAAARQPGSQPTTHRSYADQHEGLSMKERLASLEFSDAEDDDDDPLGLGKARAA